MKKILFIFVSLLIPCICFGWTLEWDDNQEADLAGYRVYTSESAPPDEVFTMVAEVVTSCYQLDDVDEGNYFTVSAFDQTGNESAKAAPIQFIIPDNTAPSVPGNLRITENACSADANNDGTVNVLDYLTYWRNFYTERGRTDCIVTITN